MKDYTAILDNPMDRLTSLTVFTRVVDSGGFSAAAQRLSMSPTMVSNHVQALENRLGVRLLNRTTRKVSVTEIGREYYERCSQVLAELDEADQIAGALQLTPRGTLRVHCDTHISRFISPVIVDYLMTNPELSIDLRLGERMPDLIEDGFDLAIRATPAPDSTLVVRQLTRWRSYLCASPDYLETHAAPKNPADLAHHNCLRYAYYPFGDEWHFTALDGRAANVRVSGNLVSASPDTLRLLAVRGGGIFLAPSFVAAEDIAAGTLIALLPDFRPVEFAINAFYPHRRHLAAKVRGLLDALVAHFVAHEQWLGSATRS